jgi:hypothetical protein
MSQFLQFSVVPRGARIVRGIISLLLTAESAENAEKKRENLRNLRNLWMIILFANGA